MNGTVELSYQVVCSFFNEVGQSHYHVQNEAWQQPKIKNMCTYLASCKHTQNLIQFLYMHTKLFSTVHSAQGVFGGSLALTAPAKESVVVTCT